MYFNSSIVSAAYMIGSILALIASVNIAKSVKKFHTYGFTFTLAVTEILVMIFFGLTKNIFLLPILFIVQFVLQVLLYITLNIFIENFTIHSKVGSVRGLFLAVFNLAVLISPLIGGLILKHYSFSILYIVAAAMLIPYLYFLRHYLHHIREPAYHQIDVLSAATIAFKNKNLRAALIGELAVSSFYATMVIYSPLYLSALGVPLTSYMTIILPLALIPLVILPYELGYLADKKFGEKEMLIIGLLILTVTSLLFVVISTTALWVWALLLIISRIGASFVETMSFSYYFKKVGAEDPSLTALFINMQGAGMLVVGTVGVIVTPFLSDRPQLMFIILGCAILWSISYVLPMKDTR
jgi:MFS family permease